MIDGGAFVTPHATRQFIERIAPGMDYEEARAAIIEGLGRASTPKPLASGRGYYVRVRGKWNFRAVLLPGERALPAVATILRSGKGRGGR